MVACPLCDARLIAEREASIHGQPAVCATCVRRVCIDCECAWHQSMTCEQHQQRLRADEQSAHDLEVAAAAARADEASLRELAALEAVRHEESERRRLEEEATAALLRTVKRCPQCGMGISHYRGHACHHIKPGSGCPSCGFHFCYVCLGPHLSCRCEYQGSTYCRPCPGRPLMIGRGADCGCPDCPDCLPGRPCPRCDGCFVCQPNG